MNKDSKIYLAGHRWLVGSYIYKNLLGKGYSNIIVRTRDELDLFNQSAVYDFLKEQQPEYIIIAAAKVLGMPWNIKYPADMLFENLVIQDNLIGWAHKFTDVKKLVYLWSSCIYPRNSPQPMREEYLMDWKVEITNEWYAVAKIAWMKLCEKIYEQYGKKYISLMPTNIYGPWDNFDPLTCHVIPWMMSRMHEATIRWDKEFVIWWTGETRREFMFVEDIADAIVWASEKYEDKQFLNVGTWIDISINELAAILKEIIGYKGTFTHDISKPDGFPRKLLDVSRIHEAWWEHKIKFEDWLRTTYDWYLKNII